MFQPTRPEGAEEAPGTGIISSAPKSPSPRWGEKMLRDIRSPRVPRRAAARQGGQAAAAPLHPWLQPLAPFGAEAMYAASAPARAVRVNNPRGRRGDHPTYCHHSGCKGGAGIY